MADSHAKYYWPQIENESSMRFHQEIPISEVGNQSGRDRIHEWLRSGADDVRTLPPWRNNLTALSRVHNLYFVAEGSRLLIYRPEFPSQKLPTFAVGNMYLPQSRPDLMHYMPQGPPHCINNVLVADLGCKEILLCACDDGDVLGYWTDSLQRMLPQRNENAAEQLQVRYPSPFFHQNVKVSAWGLAVHSNARLIAVTSNSHVVTIFAFALTELPFKDLKAEAHRAGDKRPFVPKHFDRVDNFFQNPTSSDYDPSWYMVPTVELQEAEAGCHVFRNSRDNNITNLLRTRARNYVFKLYGHSTNIPCVAFNNSNEDLRGHWLLSSDISGLTIVWDLAHMTRHRATRLNSSHLRTAGWGVFWLDKRSFRKTCSINQALVRSEYFLNSSECVIDVSPGRASVRNFASLPLATEIDNEQDGMDVDADEGDDEWLELDPPLELATTRTSSLQPQLTPRAQDTFPASTASSPHGLSYLARKQLLQSPELHPTVLTPHRRSNLHDFPVRMLEHCHWREDARDVDDPDTPVMLVSAHNLQLWQSPVFQNMSAFSPSVFMQYPLSQQADLIEEAWAGASDRLNMSVMIEELGVLLCGSGKGSVAVFTLHSLQPNPMIVLHSKLTKDVSKPTPSKVITSRVRSFSDSASGLSPHPGSGRPLFSGSGRSTSSKDSAKKTMKPLNTMRLDWVLPFESQLHDGLRPHQPLVGVAASPVQGSGAGQAHQDGPIGDHDIRHLRDTSGQLSKWRILLMYRDHTIFAYEIGWASSTMAPHKTPGQELEVLIV